MPNYREVTFWLGLALPVVFIYGYTGATIPTQWPLLSATLGLSLWCTGRLTALHWLGIAFVAYAVLSMSWAPKLYDSTGGLWKVAMWALAFWLGSTLASLTDLWKGLAIGLTVSSGVALLQALGYQLAGPYVGAGLFYNPTIAGASTALVLVALVSHQLWWYIPGILPGLLLANSRGAFAAVAVGLVCRYLHWSIALALLLVAGVFCWYGQAPSDVMRFHIWKVAYQNFSVLGFGCGSFVNIWFRFQGVTTHPEFVHNDFIQLAFEYGIGALPVYAIFIATLAQGRSEDWPTFATFTVLALVFFPLYCPVPAFVGCVVAGHLARDRYLPRRDSRDRRLDFVSRLAQQRSNFDRSGGKVISLGPRD